MLAILFLWFSGDIQSVVPVGKECAITVDRSSAGVGHVGCHITGDGNDVRTEVKDSGDGTSEISYVLPQKGLYGIQVEYGGQQIPEGFFNQEVNFLLIFTSVLHRVIRWRYFVVF